MRLCAPIKSPSIVAVDRADSVADLMEWRLDLFPKKDLTSLRKKVKIPLIITIKSEKDFAAALALQPDYIDLPFSFSSKLIQQAALSTKVILSYHEEKTSVDWEKIYQEMESFSPHHIKIAIQSNKAPRLLKFLKFVKEKKIIGVAMGEKEKLSRVLAPFLGSPWTYTPLTEDQRTAQGQLLIDEYHKLYRIQEFDQIPDVFALIGNPLDHSEGERVHNFIYSVLEIPALYLKIPMVADELKEFLSLAPSLGFRGLSVTSPLKKAVGDLIGSPLPINTLLYKKGRWEGCNTDVEAALSYLENLSEKRVAILGAGATGEALSAKLVQKGFDVSLFNRTFSRAQEVGLRVGVKSYRLKELTPTFDVLINATSSLDPVAIELIPSGKCVIDIASRQGSSPFMKKALQKGCQVISGDDFYYKQAAGQCAYWFLDNG
jgi:3-dehydroquinate dehydratase / shikimate dehydrogenase